MKQLLFLPLLLISTLLSSQDCVIPTNSVGNFEFVEVIEVGDYSVSDIYSAAMLSLPEFVASPDRLTKFKDKEIGAFVSEFEISLKPKIGINNLFFFNIKIEVKSGKYRMTVNYIDNLFIIDDESQCKCANDIAAESCAPIGCLVLNGRWQRVKCEALTELDKVLRDYSKKIDEHLAGQNW